MEALIVFPYLLNIGRFILPLTDLVVCIYMLWQKKVAPATAALRNKFLVKYFNVAE